jgi:hypothetical protein
MRVSCTGSRAAGQQDKQGNTELRRAGGAGVPILKQ